jgi:PST family polysaccharide transporter
LRSLATLDEPKDRARQIRSVLTAAASVAALAIAILALAKPLLLRLLFSPAFADASRYLRWTLLGDYLKVTSWILSAPMLASAHMRVFIAADLSATAAFVISAATLARWKSPAEGTAIAFVIMHAVHLGFCSIYVRQRHAFTWGGRAAIAWLAGLALVSGASAWSWSV